MEEAANPRVTRLLVGVTGVEVVVLAVAGFLLVQPATIAALWPWTLTPFNAAFLGGVYAASLLSAATLVLIGRWSPARIVAPMILLFTAIVLAVSLIYLQRFDKPLPTVGWVALYVIIPANAAWHVWLYRALPPADAQPLSPSLRGWCLVFATVLALYGIAMLTAPVTATAFWPWPVDAFHGRLYSVTFLTPALGLLLVARAAAWAELVALGAAMLAGGTLTILGLTLTDLRLVRVTWTEEPGTWLFVAVFALIAATGAALLAASRSRQRPVGRLAAVGLFVPARWLALVLGIAFLAAGIAGFLPPFTHAMPPDAPALHVPTAYGLLLGLFPVNAIHSLFHFTLGLLGVGAFLRPGLARTYLRAFAVVLAALTVLGLIPGLETLFGIAPLFSHDVWLHGVEAFAAAYVGFIMPGETTPTAPVAIR